MPSSTRLYKVGQLGMICEVGYEVRGTRLGGNEARGVYGNGVTK